MADKRDELDKQLMEKGKLLERCEKLEAKVLVLQKNGGVIGGSDASKPAAVGTRNSSLVDKLKASNAIATAAQGQSNASG